MPHIEAPGFVARYRFTIPVVLILIGVQIAWYTLLWTSLIRQPDLGGVDFIIFYTAGVLSNQGQLHDLYNVARQHAIQTPIVGEQFIQGGVLPFNHPPFLAPVLGLVVTENYTYSYVAWCVVQLALLALMCTTAVIWLRERGWTRGQAIMGGVALSMFYPLFISFLKGQDTIIIVLAAVIWARALSREDDRTAGLALALTVIKPQIALMLALPTLAVRWRAFAWFVGGAGVLAIVSVLLVGQRGVEDYLAILRITSRGEGFGINQSAMQNMLALMLQIVPGLGLQLAQSIAWLLYIGAVIGISAIWRKRGAPEPGYIALAATLAVFFSPHSHYHDLSLLVVPLLILARGANAHLQAALLLTLVSVALLIANTIEGLTLPASVLLVAGLAVLSVKMARPTGTPITQSL